MQTVVNMCNFNPGLGNRIKTYVSMLGKGHRVLTTNPADAYLFPEIQLATPKDLSNYRGIDGWRLDVEDNEKRFSDPYETIDFLYEKTPEYFMRKYLPLFMKLGLNEQVIQFAEAFLARYEGLKNCFGVHVRTWNNHHERIGWHNSAIFHEAIEKYSEKSHFLLCTDSPDIHEEFSDRYGDRVINREKSAFEYAESGATHDLSVNISAFLDMYLLSKCNDIVGSFGSTFTECAWWFGECRPTVCIPINPQIPLDYRNMLIQQKTLQS